TEAAIGLCPRGPFGLSNPHRTFFLEQYCDENPMGRKSILFGAKRRVAEEGCSRFRNPPADRSLILDTAVSLIASQQRTQPHFFSPKASHPKLTGNKDECMKNPPPAMKFSGLCSLNRKSSPGCRARYNWFPPGCQKLTSSTWGSCLKKRYQSLSVTPT